MGYFLRQEKKKNRVYLQMYETYWDKDKKQARSKCVKSFGYVDELTSNDIPDPIAYYKDYVNREEKKRLASWADDTRPRAFNQPIEFYAGHFLISSLISELGVKEDIDLLASTRKFRFSIYDMLCQLIYARIIFPCSKSKTVSHVFTNLYKGVQISEDQVYDGCQFIGGSYKKYIELFNHCYEQFYKRNFNTVYFDCTNYYFEIDLPFEDKQKGPSKELRPDPIIGQALLLDADLIPLGMQMYPGNQSEKPYIRKQVEEMKQRYKVTGRTVQVADKGLNCARNIYTAVKESNDGYIFSKSIHGTGLSGKEKQWLLLENSANVFTDYLDSNGQLLYRIKSCVDDFTYSFEDEDPITGKKISTTFTVREKRVVSYTPALAKKQKAQIMKQVEKASNYTTYKKLARQDLGDATKYLNMEAIDKDGKKIAPKTTLNQAKIDEDLRYAGYNLIVTSELEMTPNQIYTTYHNLWKIEESFRITKSYLDARPVYVQKKETIYGHFLICYLSLFLLRVLEIKCFNNKINTYDLINFIRDFRIVTNSRGTYTNISRCQSINEKVKSLTGLSNIDALYLTEKEVDNLFNNTMLIDPEY